jgi:ATP-dependent Clp protease ATP-binding subunit ClpA
VRLRSQQMFERFTESARQVVVFAQDEAHLLKHNYIGTEHILLGLLREEEDIAARVLASLDITLEEMRAQVVRIVGPGDEVTTGQVPFTRRGKKVLELSMREALSLGHEYIGTEHVLLGLVRENEGVAAQILLDFDADAEKIRNRVIEMLPAPRPSESTAGPSTVGRHRRRLTVQAQPLWRIHSEMTPSSGWTDYARSSRVRHDLLPIAAGWLLFAVSLGIGILVGWLIWG